MIARLESCPALLRRLPVMVNDIVFVRGERLVVLATAHAAGWSVAGQRAAIQSAAYWLLHWRMDATHSWAPSATGDELDSDTAAPTAGRREAWCYGTPGIGRALILAGNALTDPC